MFWAFHGDENGLDKDGLNFKMALKKHIAWCVKTIYDKESDYLIRGNALSELRDHFFRDNSFTKALEEDGEKWKNMVKDVLEEFYGEPIEEIVSPIIPFSQKDHQWKYMPCSKEEYMAEELEKSREESDGLIREKVEKVD